jgi:hypothetical protein
VQIFNEFNCRKLHNQWNTFAGITTQPIFLLIIAGTIVVQILIVQVRRLRGIDTRHWAQALRVRFARRDGCS